MKARLDAYRIYSDYDIETATCFLFRNISRMERCVRERELTEKSSYKEMNKIFVKSLLPFLKIKKLKIKEKMFYIFKFFSNYIKYNLNKN